MAQFAVLDKAYMTKDAYNKIRDQYSERNLKEQEKSTKEYIDKVIMGPERDLIVETAKIKRLWHEVFNPEEISDEEWYRMQLRMCKKGFDEGIKIYKVLRATYDLTHNREIAHQIRETAFNYSLLQDGIRPHNISDEAAAQWEAKHGKLQYVWDGKNIVSANGKSEFTVSDFYKYKDDNKIMGAMMAAAEPINQIEEEEEDYER
jgi:hypothetical protein